MKLQNDQKYNPYKWGQIGRQYSSSIKTITWTGKGYYHDVNRDFDTPLHLSRET